MTVITTKSTELNHDTGIMEATCIIPDNALDILREAMALYKQMKKGDIDDPAKVALRDQIIADLKEMWTQLNPS